MTRRGFVLLPLAVLLGLAVLLLANLTGERTRRDRALALRQARIQGRELALGAATLAPGSDLRIGAWTVAHGADGIRRAIGPLGIYAITADGERWAARR